jgi:hypothetical protein
MWGISKLERTIWDGKYLTEETVWRLSGINKLIKHYSLKSLRSNLGLVKPPKSAEITVIAGRNLTGKDSSKWFSVSGSDNSIALPDPFVTLKYETTKMKSQWVEKTLNPIFKSASIKIEFSQFPHNLVVECWDFNYTSGNVFMGEIIIPISGNFYLFISRSLWW